ncbi:hypothetical protein QBC44DRAFT_381583 [Cladorrhinum sp. PSN332]|nr:hypothetical protein QBC44DRAFT_381583 [Cladorrhinum sp. PSN332]
MLVIRLFWLQAALVMAQLPTLEDVLAVGGGDSSEVAAPVQSEEATPSVSLEDLVGGPVPSAAATNDSPDINLDDVTGPTDVLDLGEAAPVIVADPPITSTQDAVSVPAPVSVDPVVETSAAQVPAPQPTSEPTPVTEEAPPPPPPVIIPAPDQQDDDEETTQEPIAAPTPAPAPVPVPVPAPESSAAAAPAPQPSDEPAPAPASSAAAATAPEVTNGAGVFVPPAPASSEAAAPEESSDNDNLNPQPESTAPAGAAPTNVPADAQATSPPSSDSSNSNPQEPILTLVTAADSTFLSVFTPPAPTGVLAAIQDADNSNSDPIPVTAGTDLNLGTLPTNSPGSNSNNANPNSNGPFESPDGDVSDGIVRTQVESNGLSTSTKIGLGVGLGVGSVVLLVVVVYIMWHRRMASGREPDFEYAKKSHHHKRSGSKSSDVEKGGMGFDQRQKLDWESEHDVAFDFGFGVKRGVSARKKAAEEGGVEGVLAGTGGGGGVGVAVGDRR